MAAGSVTEMLNDGLTAADMTARLLDGLGGNDTGFQLRPRWDVESGQPGVPVHGRKGGWGVLRCVCDWLRACPLAPSTSHNPCWRPCYLLLPHSLSRHPSSAPCAPIVPACRYGPCEPADLQDRMRSAVALLGEQEVRGIMEEQGKIEVTCEFCRQTYSFSEDEVLAALQQQAAGQ